MLLRYVELQNFMSHESEAVHLPANGMFVLHGDSGSGKSSMIVDGPGFALFGVQATRFSKLSELRHHDHPGQPMSVRVVYEFADGEKIAFARGIDGRDSSWAEAYKVLDDPDADPPLLAKGANEVKRLVARKIGVDAKQFYASFVCRQQEFALLTDLRGTERKALVHQMLGMRELDKAYAIATKEYRRANAELKSLQGSIGDRTKQQIDKQLAEIRDRAQQAARRVTDGETQLRQSQTELDQAEREIAPYEQRIQAHARIRELKVKRTALETERAAAAERAERHRRARRLIDENAGFASEHQELSARRERLREDYARSTRYTKTQQTFVAASERLSEARLKLREALPEDQQLLSELKLSAYARELTPEFATAGPGRASAEIADAPSADAQALAERRAAIRAEISSAARERQGRETERDQLIETGQCFTCLRDLGDDHDHQRVLANLNGKLEQLQQAEEHGQAQLAAIERALPALKQVEETSSEVERLSGELQTIRGEGAVHENLQALVEEGERLSVRIATLEEKLAESRAANRDLDDRAETKLAELDGQLTALRSELDELVVRAGEAVDEQRVRTLQETVSRARGLRDQASGALPELGRAKVDAERDLQAAEKETEALTRQLEQGEQARVKALDLEQVQTLLQGFQRKLAHDIRPPLEEISSEMLNQISRGRHVSMQIDDNYEISVERSEGSMLQAVGLSGGEIVRANFCLRLALTRLVSQRTGVPVSFLVLDEPERGQDPGHIERIAELLGGLRGHYQQQFMISHAGGLLHTDEVDYILEFGAQGPNRIQLTHA